MPFPFLVEESANLAANFAVILRDLLEKDPSLEVSVSEREWSEPQHHANTPQRAMNIHPQQKTVFTVGMRLQDGTSVSFDVLPSGLAFPTPPRLLLNLLILLAAVIFLSLLAVRLATRPLNHHPHAAAGRTAGG